MILSEVCIKRPVFASVMSLLIFVVGIMFYGRLEIRGIPDISPPIITVTANYEGADAAYMEQNVTMRIEKILRTVKNVDSIKSTSEPEKANIMIIFKLSTDINEAMSDVRSKIAEVSDFLPKGMKLPIVQKMDFSAQPSIYMSATSDRHDDMELTAILYRTTIRALEKIDSVGHVQPFGAKFYNMQITPDPASMYALKITPIDIEMAIRAQNKDYPAGSIKTDVNSFVLKLGGALNKVEEFENIILRSDKNGMIKLSQVAKVALAPLEDEMRARYNGTQTVAMGLTKQSNSNILKMSAEVREALPQMQKELPAGVKLYIAYDAAVPVDASINSVYMTIFEALVLVVGVVYLFLQSAPLTLIPFVTIPVSLIGTFTFMYFLGFSINTFTLLAMILAIGLVVDDAIVMLENIFRHHQENGSSGQEAAITGSHEIGFTILAMTITLAAVFLPVGFDDQFYKKVDDLYAADFHKKRANVKNLFSNILQSGFDKDHQHGIELPAVDSSDEEENDEEESKNEESNIQNHKVNDIDDYFDNNKIVINGVDDDDNSFLAVKHERRVDRESIDVDETMMEVNVLHINNEIEEEKVYNLHDFES
jgi:HAE1 family hydrophobic/amphiphilic exporter-1